MKKVTLMLLCAAIGAASFTTISAYKHRESYGRDGTLKVSAVVGKQFGCLYGPKEYADQERIVTIIREDDKYFITHAWDSNYKKSIGGKKQLKDVCELLRPGTFAYVTDVSIQ